VVGCWRGYLSGARCRLAYGLADATAIHCLSKCRIGLPFWYWLTQVDPDKGPLNVCVCVRACVHVVVKMEWCTTFTHFISTVGLALSGCLCYSGLVEDGYHQNPYHNAVHAADVTQAVNCFMLETKVC